MAPETHGSVAEAALAGVAPLTAEILTAPRRALQSSSLLHALRVQQIVCCGIEPPRRGAHGGLPCVHLDAAFDARTEAAAVARLVDRAAAASRTTLLVGDDAGGSGCARLCVALLELREGCSGFEAALRVERATALPAGALV